MLWDRSEPNGYAQHITQDPYPNTPAHKVLLHEAFGDHQVANVATEVETRTLGASVRRVGQRHADPADHEHAADGGQRPARAAAEPGERPAPEVGVPEARRTRGRRLRRSTLPGAVADTGETGGG